MEFRQLEALKLIVESGSFSDSARQMGITQPSISAQISALEREFGCQLLLRQPGKNAPTDQGRLLYRYAVEILALRDKAVAGCGRHREMSGLITIAASSIPHQYVLPVLTAEFALGHPDARFDLIGCGSHEVAQKVLNGEADLGLMGTVPESPELDYLPLLGDELVAVTPATPAYAGWQNAPPTLETLLEAPFVMREAGSGTRAEVESYLERQGASGDALHIVTQTDNPDAVVRAVEQGTGVAILSALAAADCARRGTVYVFPLPGGPVKRHIYLVRHKGRALPALSEEFARFAARKNSSP